MKYYADTNQALKKKRTIQCSNCREFEHNKIQCAQVITATSEIADEKIKRKEKK